MSLYETVHLFRNYSFPGYKLATSQKLSAGELLHILRCSCLKFSPQVPKEVPRIEVCFSFGSYWGRRVLKETFDHDHDH